jgi:hypothetical protein
MKTLNEKIVEVSIHLQSLATPEFSAAVQQAVEKNDKTSLISVCRKAKIPQSYIGTVVSTILSVSPSKWPANY